MKKILIAVVVAGTGVGIALGARGHFLDEAQPESVAVSGAGTLYGVPGGGLAAERAAELGAARAAEAGSGDAASSPGSGDVGGDASADASAPPPSAEAGERAAGSSPESVTAPAETGEPTALDVLRRVAAAYEDVRSLSAEFVQRLRNPVLGSEMVSRGTLYQRQPDRFLMRFSEPAGDVIVSDGRHFWVYYPSVDAEQVVRMPAGAGGAGGVDLRAQFVGDPAARFEAKLEGTAEVAGRRTHVLTLDPRGDAPYRRLKVWVDARDSLIRRFEITEPNGNVRHFELSGLRINPPLEADLFEFTPPAGARVIDRG